MTMTVEAGVDIRPFQIDIPQGDLDDLRARLQAARFPTPELVKDASQGVQLATLKAVADYWATAYDWRSRRGSAQRAAAVQDHDRRAGHPLHPREVKA